MKIKYILLSSFVSLFLLWLFIFLFQTEYHKRMEIKIFTLENIKGFFISKEDKAEQLSKKYVLNNSEEELLEMYDTYQYIFSLLPESSEYYHRAMLMLPFDDYNNYGTKDFLVKKSFELLESVSEIALEKFCQKDSLNEISLINDLKTLYNSYPKKDICIDYRIPASIWYYYFFYKKDIKRAIDYYKLASVSVYIDDENYNLGYYEGSPILWSIFEQRLWSYQRSFSLFLELYENDRNIKTSSCGEFYDILKEYSGKFNNALSWRDVQYINEKRTILLWEYDGHNNCSEKLNQSLRAINLYYLNQAFIKSKEIVSSWSLLSTPEQLYGEWFIDYIPLDYDQNDDYWIVYEYNPDYDNFHFQNKIRTK